MSDTPVTDAFREVVFAQYKEDELTGDGMGNILAALTNIETLERKRECECKCDVDWPEEYYELRQRLERERDELKNQLIDAKSSIAHWMGKYNNAVQLRGEDPLCDSFWKTLDKLSAERALADRLADALMSTDAIIRKEVSLVGQWDSPVIFKEALTAWKEARSE